MGSWFFEPTFVSLGMEKNNKVMKKEALFLVSYTHEGVEGYLDTTIYSRSGRYDPDHDYHAIFLPFKKPSDYVKQTKTQKQFDSFISKFKDKRQNLSIEINVPGISYLTTPVDFSKFKLVEVSFNM